MYVVRGLPDVHGRRVRLLAICSLTANETYDAAVVCVLPQLLIASIDSSEDQSTVAKK